MTPRGPATPLTPAAQLEAAAAAATTAPARPPAAGKKKKLDVKDVFNQDDDDGHQKKRRKLVPLGESDGRRVYYVTHSYYIDGAAVACYEAKGFLELALTSALLITTFPLIFR